MYGQVTTNPAVVAWSVKASTQIQVDGGSNPAWDVYMVKIPESKRNFGPAVDIQCVCYI